MIVFINPWHIFGAASIVLSRLKMYSVCSSWTAAAAAEDLDGQREDRVGEMKAWITTQVGQGLGKHASTS